jgi:glycosyltransferase involved in cell wall biosynthesis
MTTTRPIHQLVHTLSYGDAISTEVLALQSAIRSLGIESEIYALHEHNKLIGRSRPFAAIGECAEADLILHYSIGSPLNDLYRGWKRGHRVLVYHNITPASWFAGVNARVARDIEQGFSDLPQLCAISDRIWADSKFNAMELASLGFNAEVLDLPIAPERWERPRHEPTYSLVKSRPGMHILHVGRLAPNKCVEDVIKSFYYLRRYINPESWLWLVGIDTDTELYSFSLRRLAANLGIEDGVEFMGCLADEQVRALYESCSAYLCMSEHEGFCLPLIEAMHFGCPVIAYGAGAVPETVGDGGIILEEKKHAEVGQLLAMVAAQGDLRSKLVMKGHERVKEFSYAQFTARLQELLTCNSKRREVQSA